MQLWLHFVNNMLESKDDFYIQYRVIFFFFYAKFIAYKSTKSILLTYKDSSPLPDTSERCEVCKNR